MVGVLRKEKYRIGRKAESTRHRAESKQPAGGRCRDKKSSRKKLAGADV